MNIHLTPEFEQLVQSKVQSGGYTSASEVVQEALRLMEQWDELQAFEIRKRIDIGLAEANRSEGVDGEAFMKGLIDDLDKHEAKHKVG